MTKIYRALAAIFLIMAGNIVTAQTITRVFNVYNADSVELRCGIVSTDPPQVFICKNTTHAYTGRIVVPETLTYNDTVWTVTGVNPITFSGASVNYVSLPSSIDFIGASAFSTSSLDTLAFAGMTPPTKGADITVSLGNNYLNHTVVALPCGAMPNWRWINNWYRSRLWSPCAVWFEVTTDDPTIEIYGWPAYYEPGETAWYYADFTGGSFQQPNNKMIIWSTGANHKVVEGPDTVHAYALTLGQPATLTANNVNAPVFPFGNMGFNGTTSNYTIGGASPLYTNGLWLSAANATTTQTYGTNSYDYMPGPLRIDGSASTDTATVKKYNRVWHLTREQIDYHIAHCGEPDYEPIDEIRSWPGSGTEGFAERMAPFYDADSNGNYNALAGDYPIIRGDECTFSIFNDVGQHRNTYGSPFGIEVHCMTYVFGDTSDASLNNTVFAHYDIYNRSETTYIDTYLGLFVDFDLGYSYDDFIGCDVRRGLFYGYNGDDEDGPGSSMYYGIPPAQGCMLLGGAVQEQDERDNGRVDIEYILNSPNQALHDTLETFRRADGTLDTVAINAAADRFFFIDYRSWHFVPGDITGNQAINGLNFGDGVVDNERLGLTGFVYYENGNTNFPNTDPAEASDVYNYLRGYWKNGQHMKFGGNGFNTGITSLDCNFMFPGDSDPWFWNTDGVVPDISYTWSENGIGNIPGDRRGLGASGPFIFEAGSVEQVDLAYTTAFSNSSTYSSVQMLQVLSDGVRRQFVHDTTDSGKSFRYMPYSAPHPVGIYDMQDEFRLAVYPNPTTSRLTVELPHPATLQLIDITGHIILTQKAQTGTTTMNLSALPRGIYILRADAIATRVVKK